jgi:hypothetical protein
VPLGYWLALGLIALALGLGVVARLRRSFKLAIVTAGVVGLLIPYCGMLYLFTEIVTRARVVGEYDDDHLAGHEHLILKQDGTYLYTFTPKTGEAFTRNGNWSFVGHFPYGEVVLDNFAPKFPGADPQNKTWRLPAEEDWGAIRLHKGETSGQFYLGAFRYRTQ